MQSSQGQKSVIEAAPTKSAAGLEEREQVARNKSEQYQPTASTTTTTTTTNNSSELVASQAGDCVNFQVGHKQNSSAASTTPTAATISTSKQPQTDSRTGLEVVEASSPQPIELPVSQNPQPRSPIDQRIKVTLSAPRNSCDQKAGPIVYPLNSQASRRRPSTATLISPAGSQQRDYFNPIHESIGTNLSRSEQETELRRIASERIKRTQQQQNQETSPVAREGDSQTQRAASKYPADSRVLEITAAAGQQQQLTSLAVKQQQQQQQHLTDPTNPKQLAIYINGKIRSNSIFCRSSSSNSFNSILNRFHHNVASGNLPDNELRDHKESPLRLCQHSSQSKCSKRRKSRKKKRRACEKGAKELDLESGELSRQTAETLAEQQQLTRQTGLVSTLRSGARRFLANHLSSYKIDKQLHKTRLEGDNTITDTTTTTTTTIAAASLIANNEPASESKSSSLTSSSSEGAPIGGTESNQSERDQQVNNYNSNHINLAISTKPTKAEEATTSYKLNPSSMFLRKAMRYYRLWIYCTNITILLGALIFILSTIYVTSDYRIRLLVGGSSQTRTTTSSQKQTNLYSKQQHQEQLAHKQAKAQPDSQQSPSDGSFEFNNEDIFVSLSEPFVLLAYAAIAIQAGLLQAIGCFGAVRMKERWIQTFWYLILALTVFDVVFLMYWLNRYDSIVKSLRHHMTSRLSQQYGGRYSAISSRFAEHLGFDSMASLTRDSNSIVVPNHSLLSAQDDEEMSQNLDKTLTKIIDKIQTDSQCCGISNSLDYRKSRWRKMKLNQLAVRLNWTDPNSLAFLRQVPLTPASCCKPSRAAEMATGDQQHQRGSVILDDSQLSRPVNVPAWSPSMVVENLLDKQQRKKLADSDSDDDPPPAPEADGDNSNADYNAESTLGELIDGRWAPQLGGLRSQLQQQYTSGDLNSDLPTNGDESLQFVSKQQRRRLAKQQNFNSNKNQRQQLERARRWSVESMVDNEEHVLSRLVELWSDEENNDDIGLDSVASILTNFAPTNPRDSDAGDPNEGQTWWQMTRSGQHGNYSEREVLSAHWDKLARLRRILFRQPASGDYTRPNYKWPNRLQLSFEQYKTIEGYLEQEKSVLERGASGVLGGQQRQRRHSTFSSHYNSGLDAAARADFSSSSSSSAETVHSEASETEQQSTANGASAEQKQVREQERKQEERARKTRRDTVGQAEQLTKHELERLSEELAKALMLDPETGCSPRSYYDQATIYTRGCQPAIKSWLDSSAHILFVTGFCVLTVLKFCSLVLLRLEIREMIHKIRVLKGMATEYNALHDLEAYLPRPSVCAQAAELTASGVALANPSAPAPAAVAAAAAVSAAAMSANSQQAGGIGMAGQACTAAGSLSQVVGVPVGAHHRLGGSFSEAVAAATAVAAAQTAAGQASSGGQLAIGGLASTGRAASMKAMAAMSSMLTPILCPRSSSASSAHLHAACTCSASQKHALSLRSAHTADLFQFQANGVMSRRHTAVSVCPAAAAAAAAAAHHLMSRRGTYVANPINFNASPLINNSTNFNLNQHRHSAHTVHTLNANNNNISPLLTQPLQFQRQQQTALAAQASNSFVKVRGSRHHLGDTTNSSTAHTTIEHQSSAESSQLPEVARNANASSSQLHSSGGSHQLLSLVYPFKRQSSGGAQSACNFSLDLAPAPMLESRRSIH